MDSRQEGLDGSVIISQGVAGHSEYDMRSLEGEIGGSITNWMRQKGHLSANITLKTTKRIGAITMSATVVPLIGIGPHALRALEECHRFLNSIVSYNTQEGNDTPENIHKLQGMIEKALVEWSTQSPSDMDDVLKTASRLYEKACQYNNLGQGYINDEVEEALLAFIKAWDKMLN